MPLELSPAELEIIIEGLDYYKSKIAFTKGGSYQEKTEKLQQADVIEEKLRRSLATKEPKAQSD